jgi:hypothetical protein
MLGWLTRKRMSTSLVSISGLFFRRDLSIIFTATLSPLSLFIPSLTTEKLPLRDEEANGQRSKAAQGAKKENEATSLTVEN